MDWKEERGGGVVGPGGSDLNICNAVKLKNSRGWAKRYQQLAAGKGGAHYKNGDKRPEVTLQKALHTLSHTHTRTH